MVYSKDSFLSDRTAHDQYKLNTIKTHINVCTKYRSFIRTRIIAIKQWSMQCRRRGQFILRHCRGILFLRGYDTFKVSLRSTGRMFSAYCSFSYICASTKNLAGHDFVSVNKFGRVFIYITHSLCMMKYEYQRKSFTRHNCFHG